MLTSPQVVLEQLIDRESRLNKMTLELEDQKSSRCRYPQEAIELQTKFSSLTRKIVISLELFPRQYFGLTYFQAKTAFVAVLIDGDGAKFTDELLQAQENGGAVATCRLKEAVRHYLSKEQPELSEEDTLIVVKIWANLGGLSNALYNNGSIGARDQLFRFAESFSRSQAEFDFVNVGKGKENADGKMRRMCHFYYNNVHGKKIIFAGCHDAGYIHDLQEEQGTEEAKQRIVLLETTSAEAQFAQLGFPITRFESVFRSTPLRNETKQSQVPPLSARPSGNEQCFMSSPPSRAKILSNHQTRPLPAKPIIEKANEAMHVRRKRTRKALVSDIAMSVGEVQAMGGYEEVQAEIIEDIPRPKKRALTCSNCGQQGHTIRTCPTK